MSCAGLIMDSPRLHSSSVGWISRPIVADGNNRPSSSYLRPFIFWRECLQYGARSSAGGWGMFPTGFPLASSFPWRRLLYLKNESDSTADPIEYSSVFPIIYQKRFSVPRRFRGKGFLPCLSLVLSRYAILCSFSSLVWQRLNVLS